MTDLPPLQDAAFRLIIEDAPDGILLVDQAGRIIFANRQVRELFGYEPRELIGQRVEVLMPSRKRAMHVIHREIYQERPETRPMGTGLDLAGQRKDGTEFPVEISLSRLSTVGGSFSVAAVRDVSRQRRAEEALRRSEERHRLLAEQARDVIFRYRLLPTPGFEYVSAAMQRLLGYPPEEFYVDDGLIFRVVHSEDREILERALTADGPRSFELRLRDRKGEVRWFEQGISPVVDSQGVIVALEGIARDVTERRTAEEDRSQLLLEVERQLERERIAGRPARRHHPVHLRTGPRHARGPCRRDGHQGGRPGAGDRGAELRDRRAPHLHAGPQRLCVRCGACRPGCPRPGSCP